MTESNKGLVSRKMETITKKFCESLGDGAARWLETTSFRIDPMPLRMSLSRSFVLLLVYQQSNGFSSS